MITAEEARRLSEEKYITISDEIERIARYGGHEYRYRSSSPIPDDLYMHLVENGYNVILKKETECDEDHYGKDVPGTERTMHICTIIW